MTDQPRSDAGYVNFFAILGLDPAARPGDVRREYRRLMKNLVTEIRGAGVSGGFQQNQYLLDMAKLNAALVVLRDTESRDAYWQEREALIALEAQWCEADAAGTGDTEPLRRAFDSKVRSFLSKYVEEMMIGAGRDKECVEASYWDAKHERHASNLLRHYRHTLYHQILERLPYSEVTRPQIDWTERRQFVTDVVKAG